MSDRVEYAREVELYLQRDEEDLLKELGVRQEAMLSKPEIAGAVHPTADVLMLEELGVDAVKEGALELGRKLFRRWSRELHDVVCGTDHGDIADREKILSAANLTQAALAGAVVSALVSLGAAPLVATVIAALLIKRIFHPAGEEICKFWADHLD